MTRFRREHDTQLEALDVLEMAMAATSSDRELDAIRSRLSRGNDRLTDQYRTGRTI